MMVRPFALARRGVLAAFLFIALTPAFQVSPLNAQNTGAAPASAAATDEKSNSISKKDRLKTLDEVWKTVDEKFYNPSFNGVDWKAMRERYRPKVEKAGSDEEFYEVLNRMVRELHDSHTRVHTPQRRLERRLQQATSAGVFIYEVEGTPVVLNVAADSEAARAGIVPGMVVRTVNDRPVAEALAEAGREIGTSSSERATRILTYRKLIDGAPDTTFKLGLTGTDGKPLDATLTRRKVSAPAQVTVTQLESGYVHVKINRFFAPVAEQMREELKKFKSAPGVILDLRSNNGGNGQEGLMVAGCFFAEPVLVANMVMRDGKPRAFSAVKADDPYTGPVVVLVNDLSASTSELVVSAMQERGRAHVIGSRSCGCVVGIRNHKELKGGGELAVGEVAFVTPKGRTLEGNGITPDKTVTLTLADLRHGRDVALEEAEKYLNGMSKKQ